jgi:transposase InsO family protein
MNIITQINQQQDIAIDALCDAVAIPRATYYRNQQGEEKNISTIAITPKNSLRDGEKQAILNLLHSERFVDKTPYQVFNTLLDEGKYHCSPRTMYRLLESQAESGERRVQRNHRDAIKPELIAVRPNEVWSWDITKLLSPKKWVYFYLYVILDIYSRYVVGWLIADCESKELARQLIEESALKNGIQRDQLTLHSDNGPSMVSHTVAQLLDDLGITKTHNRPYTSNDNPFSESQFKTLKYCAEFPGQFSDLNSSELFCKQFFSWYNNDHYHSGIAWLTPKSVHYGHGADVLEKRHQAMLKAYFENPARFNNKIPMLKQLPAAVYINPPQAVEIRVKNENIENNC